MTPVEIALAALVVVLLVIAITASLVNMAIALTEMIERWREQRRAR
ncbi:protein of unknown function [Hyphomicrobium sp. 1Nfss2.1]